MRRLRRVKIVATLGPATKEKDVVASLFSAGADVFRINMSHSDHDDLRERVRIIRELEEEYHRPIGILVDLQGPKLRIGEFVDGTVSLTKGEHFVLDSNTALGDATRVYLPHPEILAALEPGHTLLIDDGKVRLSVISVEPAQATALVQVGGEVSNRKGISLPDTHIPVSAMTEKDREDLDAALAQGVDWIALSFVQRVEDVLEVKRIVNGRALVLSKIEKPQAIRQLDAIIEASDALMVARGDLGVEMPAEKVPGLQKMITRSARRLGRPVVIATQMLESMISMPVPTRAEVSDVANAIFDGADAVMLSAESASGRYPVEAVETHNRIAEEIEGDPIYRTILNTLRIAPEATEADAIAIAAKDVAETLDSKAIVAWTSSGSTAFRISRERPEAPVLALTPSRHTARRLTLVWGVHAVVTKDIRDEDDMVDRGCKFANREGFSNLGDRIIIIAGIPFGMTGGTNMLRIAFTGEQN